MLSCKSVDSLVRKGKYDEAFEYALKQLSKKKGSKTENVIALEKAYAGLMRRDLQEIERLSATNRPDHNAAIVRQYEKLIDRQNKVSYFLPVVSEDGYEASFEMRDYAILMRDAREKTALVYYNEGKNLMAEAEYKKDKNLAKKAYYAFEKSEQYVYGYKDVVAMKNKALESGHKYIYIELVNHIHGRAGQDIEQYLWNYALGRHDDKWHSFRFAENNELDRADMVIRLEIGQLNISPEIENNYHSSEQKEIFVRSDKKIEKRDTVFVEVIRDVYETVHAKIVETFREKHASLEGNILVYDSKGWRLMSQKPVLATFDFSDRGMVFTGDNRALSEETRKKLDGHLSFFPEDQAIVAHLLEQYKHVLSKEVNSVKS